MPVNKKIYLYIPINKKYHVDLISFYLFNKSRNIYIYFEHTNYIINLLLKKSIYRWKQNTTNSSFSFDFYSQYFFLINLFFLNSVLISEILKNQKFIFRLFFDYFR
jgi:pilus assembly protein TadC